ncbi:MAG: hypothetical protein U0822_09085 [Anaerolineae bacterium]
MAPRSASYRRVFVIVLALLGLALLAVPGVAAHSATPATVVTQPQVPVDPPPITLAPGESVTLDLEAFCLDYNIPFPRQFPPITDLSTQETIQILRYSISKGYTTTNPYQVQLALWRQTTGRWVDNVPHAIAEEIYNNAPTQAPPLPTPAPDSVSLTDAIAQNLVKVEYLQWTTIGGVTGALFPWHARGQVRLTNTGEQPITLDLATGTRLVPKGTQQRMIVYWTNVAEQPTPGPSPTATPTPRPHLPPTGGDNSEGAGLGWIVLGAFVMLIGLLLFAFTRNASRQA